MIPIDLETVGIVGMFLAAFVIAYFAPDLFVGVVRFLFNTFDPPKPARHLSKVELTKFESSLPAREPAPLRVYVAASSRELERVDRALEGLAKIPNVEVTYRWIDDMRVAAAAGKTDADLTRSEALDAGTKCLEGVFGADVFWLLYPNEPTRGAWIELGYARALFDTVRLEHIVVSYEGRTSVGACPLALDDIDDYHETLGDQRGLELIADLAHDLAHPEHEGPQA